MHTQLAEVVTVHFTFEHYVDDNMRNIPDHYHAHARPKGGFFGHGLRRRSRASRSEGPPWRAVAAGRRTSAPCMPVADVERAVEVHAAHRRRGCTVTVVVFRRAGSSSSMFWSSMVNEWGMLPSFSTSTVTSPAVPFRNVFSK